ncbi:MAG: zf-HC2 domain-containing protein, partial [Oscillospiraceae bacterium]|nr:zf-HC2 domain-containing protein [Oscillospiraceae bacterium]
DLLPLYQDGVCSGESRRAVEEHLAGCADCPGMLARLQSCEIEEMIGEEKEGVLRRQTRFFKRRSALFGSIVAGIFMIPILVCLIVDLASGSGLTWFFVVLASLLVASSLIIVPLMARENKFLWTVATFVPSLLILLGVCCLYTRGRWFLVAATASLFGLAVVLLPIVVHREPVAARLKNHKGVAVMAADTVLYALMMVCIGLFVRDPYYPGVAFVLSVPCVALAWAVFALIRCPRYHGLIKAGTCTALIGAFLFFAEPLIKALFGAPLSIPAFAPFCWDAYTISGNVLWSTLLLALLVAVVLTLAGLLKERRK